MNMLSLIASAALIAAGSAATTPVAEPDWRERATEADQKRVAGWREALTSGTEGAVAAGQSEKLTSRTPLFDPDAGLERSMMPAGLYHCSLTKLGGEPDRGLPYIAYPSFRCRVVRQGNRFQFTKLTGSQLTAGWIYQDGDRQSVYVGTAFYEYEDRAAAYGQSEKRDQVAVVHRIGNQRWRMIYPFPYYESVVNVMELTPVRLSLSR
ncbi:protein of unknown function [Parasphingorhabdus marina DSM 22363]|uniref:DUF4893 domain-containing protein n=1 Tax=Parasphingorhabdus marina DSM 22363 TaxID=1123272 RepID=A0A1N6EVB9_9SPHN|nr:DUF4893 domain-containing protein [Parasphingorhabdus marina]SIN87019.1 protein of unknown function [Parasphingorhabdus marina DSM 22363]